MDTEREPAVAPVEPIELRPPLANAAPVAGGGRPILTAVASLAVVAWLVLALGLLYLVANARHLNELLRFALGLAVVASVVVAIAWLWSRPWRR